MSNLFQHITVLAYFLIEKNLLIVVATIVNICTLGHNNLKHKNKPKREHISST